MISPNTSLYSRPLLALLALSFLAFFGSACTFDPAPIDERRCLNDAACLESFGEGWECVNEYCQQQVCIDDVECDNGIFCDGPEKCLPDDSNANIKGCVAGEFNIAELAVDDEVDCTNDFCDEIQRRVIHDATGCECSGANDRACALLNNNPCVTSICDTATFTCATTPKEISETCTPEFSCVQNGVCDANGACVPSNPDASNKFCRTVADGSRGFFCNGDEACDPTAPGADPETGCIPGEAPVNVEEIPACAQSLCFEQGIDAETELPIGVFTTFPTEACECATDEDCPQDDCKNWTCSDTFTCVIDENTPNDTAGTACDDGVACTARDSCDNNGNCVGDALSDFYCAEIGCSAGGVCDPNNGDAQSGCVCDPSN